MSPLTARYEDGPRRRLAGYREHYTLETRAAIPQQWQRFAPHIGTVPGQVGSASYGAAWNGADDCNFDYLTGVEVSDAAKLPAGFAELILPAGRYAVFTHLGHASGIVQTLEEIWSRWLPASGHKTAPAPCYERYDERFDPRTGTGAFDIWVPLSE